MPEPIPDTPENVARAAMQGAAKEEVEVSEERWERRGYRSIVTLLTTVGTMSRKQLDSTTATALMLEKMIQSPTRKPLTMRRIERLTTREYVA